LQRQYSDTRLKSLQPLKLQQYRKGATGDSGLQYAQTTNCYPVSDTHTEMRCTEIPYTPPPGGWFGMATANAIRCLTSGTGKNGRFSFAS